MAKVQVVVFDANETLLDLSALDPELERGFSGNVPGSVLRKAWFRQLMELFLTATIVDDYRSFEQLGDAALDMVGGQYRLELSKDGRAAVHERLLTLPPHADVRPALERLTSAGIRLAVLTNSTERSATAQFGHAGLAGLFERILSADAVRRYKPARVAYGYAAWELGGGTSEMRLVAAHAWDVSGALRAGCRAAFVRRADKVPSLVGARPDVDEADLVTVAERIVELNG